MKKKIIIWAFCLLILATAIYTVVTAIEAYIYDINNGVDILEGFEAFAVVLIGGFIILYELDLFYTTYYFLVKPKTVTKSILNVFCNLSLLSVLVLACLLNVYMELRKFENAPVILFVVYFNLRLIYLSVAVHYWE